MLTKKHGAVPIFSVAIVIPWFLSADPGGAENLARELALGLASLSIHVEVLTTTSKSFTSDWTANGFRPGKSVWNGVTIRRFRLDRRNRSAFDDVNSTLLHVPRSVLLPGLSPLSEESERSFCSENINSTELLAFIVENERAYDHFIFLPYLYGTTLNGIRLVAHKALLQPCLHDEAYAYLRPIQKVMSEASGLLFNTEGEYEVALKLYGPGIIDRSTVVGTSIVRAPDVKSSRSLPVPNPFVLYLGARSEQKNLHQLIRSYLRYRAKSIGVPLALVLAGSGTASFDDRANGVYDLGRVSEDDKWLLLREARALMQPSTNESFSRVIMEAWASGCPVGVDGRCVATSSVVDRVGAGWIVREPDDWYNTFATAAAMNDKERAELAAPGTAYVSEFGSWDIVLGRYLRLFQQSAAARRGEAKKSSKPLRREVHQLVPMFEMNEALSNRAMAIREYLESLGCLSYIYASAAASPVPKFVKVAGDTPPMDSLILYHHRLESVMSAVALAHQGPKALLYYHITPDAYFSHLPSYAIRLTRARDDLPLLSKFFEVSAASSQCSLSELRDAGYRRPELLPIEVAPGRWNLAPDETLLRELQDSRTNLLFVGRIVSNKRLDQLLAAFTAFLRMDASARLIIVGKGDPTDHYFQKFLNLLNRPELDGHVLYLGQVSEAQLQACYRAAHLFWSMSEHQEFASAIVEAMWFDVPVCAFKTPLIAERLDGAGIMFCSKDDLLDVAGLAHVMTKDNALRALVIEAQRARRTKFARSEFLAGIERVLGRLQRL